MKHAAELWRRHWPAFCRAAAGAGRGAAGCSAPRAGTPVARHVEGRARVGGPRLRRSRSAKSSSVLPRAFRARSRASPMASACWCCAASASRRACCTRLPDCFRGLGWRIQHTQLERDAQQRLWRCRGRGRRPAPARLRNASQPMTAAAPSSMRPRGSGPRRWAGRKGRGRPSPSWRRCDQEAARIPGRRAARARAGGDVAGDARLARARAAAGRWATALHIGPFERQTSVPIALRWATHLLALPALDGRRIAGWRLKAEGRIASSHVAHPAACNSPRWARSPADRRSAPERRSARRRSLRGHRCAGRRRAPGQHRSARRARAKAPLQNRVAARRWRARAVGLRGLAARAAARADRRQRGVEARCDARRRGLAGHEAEADPRRRRRHRPGTEALRDVDVAQRCRPQPAGGRIEGLDPECGDRRRRPALLRAPWLRARGLGHGVQGQPARGRAAAGRRAPSPSSSPSCSTPATNATPRASCASGCMRRRWSARSAGPHPAALPRAAALGDGICGAEAAARHHLGKSASQLKPREAGWLASLLINPTSSCASLEQRRVAVRESAPPGCSRAYAACRASAARPNSTRW